MKDPSAPESAPSAEARFGAWLREQRELRGIDVAYVVTFTRLSLGQIESLEAGQWERFAAGVYLRGAVMNYARAIGADAEEVVSRLTIEVPHAFGGEGGAHQELPEALTETVRPSLRPARKAVVVGALGVIVAGLLLWGAVEREQRSAMRPGDSANHHSEAPLDASAAVSEVTSVALPISAVTAAPVTAGAKVSPPASEPAQPEHRIVLRAGADSWIEVQADEQAPQSRILRKGRTWTITAQRAIRVRAGNAGGVTIVVDGTPVAAPLGPAGAVRERHWSFE